jgi:hypothetical protein
LQNETFNQFPEVNEKVIQVKELENLLPELKIDWLKAINDQLMKDSKVSGNDFVLMKNFKVMQKLTELLVTTDKS